MDIGISMNVEESKNSKLQSDPQSNYSSSSSLNKFVSAVLKSNSNTDTTSRSLTSNKGAFLTTTDTRGFHYYNYLRVFSQTSFQFQLSKEQNDSLEQDISIL